MKHITPEDMPAFMAELRAINSPSRRALEALILSGLRTNPVRYLRLEHLDFAKAKWTVPAALMKVDDDGKPFELPMSTRLIAVLKQQIAYVEDTFEQSPISLLWPGDPNQVDPLKQPISENTMRDLLVKRMGYNATPHGFRASFKTWAENQLQDDGETMKFNPAAIEYCLAHNPGDKVERAYRRNQLWKPRVAIMNAWSGFLSPPKATLRVVAS